MSGTRSATGGRLLLFAALLFGIFTMHTVGHPAEHSGTGPATATASHVMTGPVMTPGPVKAVRHDTPPPMPGMDPLSVCVAVLGAWGIALLTLWPAVRRCVSPRPGPGRGRSPRMPRPPPPPPRPRKAVLTGLSVLRI
ncbi:hypothetical protein [Streptomyces sp. NBC_01358]|uniref:hypothetical protein n=1 Tax=Streptomyces sp. NBC_01358 TaxID=2903837 RepID=UPI002E33EAC9|nr:hypothetical protein [Streptomyces sp. NBC_01358]